MRYVDISRSNNLLDYFRSTWFPVFPNDLLDWDKIIASGIFIGTARLWKSKKKKNSSGNHSFSKFNLLWPLFLPKALFDNINTKFFSILYCRRLMGYIYHRDFSKTRYEKSFFSQLLSLKRLIPQPVQILRVLGGKLGIS